MFDGIILLWSILTILSVLFVLYDLIFVTPNPWVMKIGWILVVLYTGVFGLFIYLLSCREPIKNTHEQFISPLWKQAVGSTIHCLAGDATGIIILEIFLSFFTISRTLEMTLEYIGGFLFGLFIFQSIFMKKMLKGSYFNAIKKTFYPEWLSMNLIMGGMIPVMIIFSVVDPLSEIPNNLHFFAKMSFATIVGALFSFPGNYWLVKHHLKHGMMTIQKEEKPMMDMSKHEVVSSKKKFIALIFSIIGLLIGIIIAIIFVNSFIQKY